MTRISAIAAAALAMLAAGPARAAADVPVHLLLKSGERVAAQWKDHEAERFVFTVNGTERRLRADDIVAIDFTGKANTFPEKERGRISLAWPLVVMRDGHNFDARVNDVVPGSPLSIRLDTPDGMKDVSSADVSRIYLARPPAESELSKLTNGDTGQTASEVPAGAIVVPANTMWTATPLRVVQGDMVAFNATGKIRLSVDPADDASPAGSIRGRYAGRAPMPQTLAGALIGRIGPDGQPFGIGDQTQALPMPGTGQLYLGVNDDHVSDNSGQFHVKVEHVSRSRSRR